MAYLAFSAIAQNNIRYSITRPIPLADENSIGAMMDVMELHRAGDNQQTAPGAIIG